jgi:molecular chaperone GrpE
VFNPFKKNRRATDMTTPENDSRSIPPDANPFVDGAAMPDLSAAGAPADAETAAPSLAQRLADLEAKHTEVSDAYLRAKAEAENTRRRAEEDVSKARKYAVESFAESLLPVMDSMQAAIAMPDAKVETVLEGVHATLRQLGQALERNKVVQIAPPAGTKFDPHQHQAISMVPADQDANTVVAVLQKGYLINDRVLRPALVTVAAPK